MDETIPQKDRAQIIRDNSSVLKVVDIKISDLDGQKYYLTD
jgi:hypothetical protein